MSFADLIKKGSLRQFATVTVATAATVKPQTPSTVASVATVSVATAQKQATNESASAELPVQENLKKPQLAVVSDLANLALKNLPKPALPVAANDPAQVPERVAGDAVASLIRRETSVRKQLVRSEVRTETLFCSTAAVKLDPDRCCWPHSSAMTGREIDTFAERSSLFNRRGLPALDAERLADKLVNRDREADERRLCLECAHLAGRSGAMRCAQWQRAGLGALGIPVGLAMQLQHCDGFLTWRMNHML